MYRVFFFILISSILFGAMKDKIAHENSLEDTNNLYIKLQNQEINLTNQVNILLLKEHKELNFVNDKLPEIEKR